MYCFLQIWAYSLDPHERVKRNALDPGAACTTTPLKKSRFFDNAHARKFHGCKFHEGKSPCGMQLAHPGLINTRNVNTNQKSDWTYAGNPQECCFYGGKSPCGMQRARQGLVKLNSGKIQSKMSISDTSPIEMCINYGLGDPEGLGG